MIEPADQARLLAGLRGRGDERRAAQRELFERLQRPLYALALRMTGRPDLADDALQEAFADVLSGIEGFRGEAQLSTWVYRVATRAAARVAAGARNRTATLPDELAAGTDEPPETLAQREGAARILAAMSRLPPAQRAVLALAALDDLPQTEIAAVLGVPPGTVYSRLSAARERLGAELARAQEARRETLSAPEARPRTRR